jgi:hypothetical protein
MRARYSCLGGILVACLCAGPVFAQAADEPPLQLDPYNKHHDRHFGHDHVYPDRGSIFRDAPKGSAIVNYAGLPYRFFNGVWFEPRGPVFIVVMPPVGVVVPSLPAFATPLELGGESYFYANDVYYLARPELGGYEVVNDPSDMAPIPARSGVGPGAGGVSGESAVVTAAPLAAAVPVSAAGTIPATSAVSATAPAATRVAAGTATLPVGATAATVVEGATTSVSRTMAAGPYVAPGATGAAPSAGSAVPYVAVGPTSAAGSSAPVAPTVAVGPTSAAGSSAPVVPAVAVGPTSTAVLSAPAAPGAPATAMGPTRAPAPTGTTDPSYVGAPTAAAAPTIAQSPATSTTPPASAPTAGTAVAAVAPAQTPPAVQPIPPGVTGIPLLGSSSAGGAKPMAYARNGQSQDRQARDHYDCYQFGVAQSSYDPMRAGYGVASSGNQLEFERARAACFEGRGYTVR